MALQETPAFTDELLELLWLLEETVRMDPEFDAPLEIVIRSGAIRFSDVPAEGTQQRLFD